MPRRSKRRRCRICRALKTRAADVECSVCTLSAGYTSLIKPLPADDTIPGQPHEAVYEQIPLTKNVVGPGMTT